MTKAETQAELDRLRKENEDYRELVAAIYDALAVVHDRDDTDRSRLKDTAATMRGCLQHGVTGRHAWTPAGAAKVLREDYPAPARPAPADDTGWISGSMGTSDA